MASDFKAGAAVRNAITDAITPRLNSGSIPIRTTPIPLAVADASTGTLLATPNFGATAFGAAATGQATANAIAAATAVASGTAAYFRLYPSAAIDTAADWQGTAGVAADVTDMTFDNKTIVSGGTVAISSMTFTTPIQ